MAWNSVTRENAKIMLTRNGSHDEDSFSSDGEGSGSFISYVGEDEREILDGDMLEEYEYRTGSSCADGRASASSSARSAELMTEEEEKSDGMVRGATILRPAGSAASGGDLGLGLWGARPSPPRSAAAGGSSTGGGGGWTVVSDDGSGECLGEVRLDDCDSTLSGSGMKRSRVHSPYSPSPSTGRRQRGRVRPSEGGDLSIPESLPSEMGSITIEQIDEGSEESISGAFMAMSRGRKMLVIGAAVFALAMSGLLAYNGYRWRREAVRLEEELRRVREERELALQSAVEAKDAADDAEAESSDGDFPNLFSAREGQHQNEDPTFTVDNCWIHAEAKVSLGQCAADARDAFSSSFTKITKTAEDGLHNFFGTFKDAAQGSWDFAARDSPWTPHSAATAAAAAYAAAQEKTRAASESAREQAREAARKAERSAREAARKAERSAKEAARSTAKVATTTAKYAERFSKRALSSVKIASQSIVEELSEATAGMSAEVLGTEAAVAIEEALGDLWDGVKDGIEEHTSLFTRHVSGARDDEGEGGGDGQREQARDEGNNKNGGEDNGKGDSSKGAAASAAEMLQRMVYL